MLDAAGPEGVSVTINQTLYRLSAGEQLMIASPRTGIASPVQLRGETVTPLRPVAFEERDGKGTVAQAEPLSQLRLHGSQATNSDVYVFKAAVNLTEEIPKLPFLQCRTCHFRNDLEARYQLARKRQIAMTRLQATETQSPGRQLETRKNQPQNITSSRLKPLVATESTDGNLKPVSAAQVLQMLAPFPATVLPATDLTKVSEDHYKLSRGSMLMKVERSLRIDTPHAIVLAKAGSIVMLTANGNITRVRDMVDSRKNGVVVKLGQHEHSLVPGKELTISTLRHKPMNALLSDDLARRQIKETEVGGLSVIGADFSIMDALIKHPLLKAMRASHRNVDRDMLRQIEKNAAIVSVLIDRQAGPYYEPKVEPNTGVAIAPDERIY